MVGEGLSEVMSPKEMRERGMLISEAGGLQGEGTAGAKALRQVQCLACLKNGKMAPRGQRMEAEGETGRRRV